MRHTKILSIGTTPGCVVPMDNFEHTEGNELSILQRIERKNNYSRWPKVSSQIVLDKKTGKASSGTSNLSTLNRLPVFFLVAINKTHLIAFWTPALPIAEKGHFFA